MGVILHKKLNENCLLGIWEITENYDDLINQLTLNEMEISTLQGFKNHNRKLEWLSVRTLIKEMTGKNTRVIYNDKRKPFLNDNSYNISISHSHMMTAVLISRNSRVGIDMEYMSHRIQKIADRFIHDSEKISDDPELKKYHLYIHWCAKEAIYKICDRQGIHFKKDIRIEPFEPKDEGCLSGTVMRDDGQEQFNLCYFSKDDYIIVWSCIK